jgi:outer membrane protein TolC
MKKAFLQFIIISTLALCASAQAQNVLTLEACLNTAFDKSYTARSAREQLRSSEAIAGAARRALFSTVDLSFDFPSYSRSLQAQFNSNTKRYDYYPLENTQFTGRLDISQPIIWTNSSITLSGIMYRQDQSETGTEGSFTRTFYTNLAMVLKQPLFVPNTQRISLRKAEIDYEESRSDYRRMLLDLQYTVTDGFYRLYSAQEQMKIQSDRVAQQEESFATAQRKYRSGLIAEVEAMQFDVDLAAARNDLLTAENDFVSRSNSFKTLIGIPLTDSLRLTLTDTSFRAVAIDLPKAVAEAKKTRVDLQRAKNNVERSQLSLDQVEGQRTIRGDVTLSYGLSKDDAAFNTLYNKLRDTRSATFTLTVPVFDWGKHSLDIESAEANLRSSQLTLENTEITIEQEITDLVRRINSSARRVSVMYQSRLVAEKANEINTKRFEVGTIGALELSQAQSRLLQARLGALDALIDYNIALADIKRRTSWDFVVDKPVEFQ